MLENTKFFLNYLEFDLGHKRKSFMEILGKDGENSQKLCKNNTSETTGKGVMHKL